MTLTALQIQISIKCLLYDSIARFVSLDYYGFFIPTLYTNFPFTGQCSAIYIVLYDDQEIGAELDDF